MHEQCQNGKVLEHRVATLESAVLEIRNSVRSIEGAITVLARIETRHEHILDTMSRQQQRLDTHGEALDALAPRVAVLEQQAVTQGKRQDTQGTTLLGLLIGLITTIAGGLLALLGKGG